MFVFVFAYNVCKISSSYTFTCYDETSVRSAVLFCTWCLFFCLSFFEFSEVMQNTAHEGGKYKAKESEAFDLRLMDRQILGLFLFN